MKILVDTNVLISAFVFGGQAGKLLDHPLAYSPSMMLEFLEKRTTED